MRRWAGPALLLALTACASTTSPAASPARLLATARATAESATSVHVAGTLVQNGQPVTLDLRLLTGVGAVGTVTLPAGRLSLVRIADTLYLNGTLGFYRRYLSPTAATALAGRWVSAPASSGSFAQLADYTDSKLLFDSALHANGILELVPGTLVDGRRTVGIAVLVGSIRRGTLYAAAVGPPYPLRLDSGPGSPTTGTLTFSDYGLPVTVLPPKKSVPLSRLGYR